MGTWFLLTPFLLRELGPTHYGLWVLVGSFVAYGSLLNFGMGGALTKYVAEYRSRGEFERSRAVIATSLWLYLGLGLAAALVIVAVAPIYPALFRVPLDEQELAVRLVMIMGLNIGVAIPCAATTSVLMGLQRYDLYNAMTLGVTLLSAVATVAVLGLGGDVAAMAAVNIPVVLLMQLPAVLIIRRVAPELGFGLRGARLSTARELLAFSSSLFLGDVATRLQTQTDEIVIGAVLAVASVTPYAIARKLSEAALMVTEAFLKVILPLASELHAVDDHARLKALYLAGTRLTLAIFLSVGCALMVVPDLILRVWVGEEFVRYSPLVAVLSLASLINVARWPAANVLQGMGRARFQALAAIGNGLANLGLSIVLAPTYGLTGVALGTLIPTIVESLCVLTPYTLRVTGVRLVELSRQALIPALLPAVPAVLVLLTLRSLVAVAELPSLVLVVGSGALTYSLIYLALSQGGERRLVFDIWRRVVRTLVPGQA
jgi:O-antigen/teichoic acid export membrane protein